MYGYEDEYYEYYYDDEDLGLLDPAWERQQKKVSLRILEEYELPVGTLYRY